MIGTTGDREFGIRLLEDGYLRDQMSSDAAYVFTYGRYLMHGGDPEKFMDLNTDDVQIMYITDTLYQRKSTNDLLEGFVKILEKVFKNA